MIKPHFKETFSDLSIEAIPHTSPFCFMFCFDFVKELLHFIILTMNLPD